MDNQALKNIVQRNCHISDARHAGDYTMCVYLLKMREYYRWEHGYEFSDSLPSEAVGDWLREREQLWETLEPENFSPLPVNGDKIDPFDSDAANNILMDHGLIYSGGYGMKQKPLFFLADLEREENVGNFRILISGREHARDLTAPPAMSLDGTIYIRRESLRRFIWERVEEWKWNRPENAMGRAIRCYHFDKNPGQALEHMTENEVESTLLHEIGEIRAGDLLGTEWKEMLGTLPRSHAEIMLRAVRDHLADALSTLPELIDAEHPERIHFYFANLTSMRKKLFPASIEAYNRWCNGETLSAMKTVFTRASGHWLKVAKHSLSLYNTGGAQAGPDIENYITTQIL